MYEQHLKDVYSYARRRHSIEGCKDTNTEKEYPSVGEKIEKHETCILPQNLSVGS